MNRVVLWVLVGLVVAGVAAFVLQEGDEALDGLRYDEVEGEETRERNGPALQASGHRVDARPSEGVLGNYHLTGTVFDEKGQPLAGVPIEVRRTGNAYDPRTPETYRKSSAERIRQSFKTLQEPRKKPRPIAAEAVSGADGTFTVDLTHSGLYEVKAAPAIPLFGTHESKSLYEGHEEESVGLYALPGTALRGRVLDTDDHPLAATLHGSWWRSLGMTHQSWKQPEVETNPADGTFAFAIVPPGSVRLSLRLTSGRSISGIAVETPHPGEFVIRVDRSANLIQGTVTDATGTPVAAALVLLTITRDKNEDQTGAAENLHATTNEVGSYKIEDAPLGKLTRARTTADGFLGKDEFGTTAPWQGAVVAADKTLTVDLTLARGGVVTGIVTEEGGSMPLADVKVSLYALRGSNGVPRNEFLAPVQTDAQGRYRVVDVAKGRYLAICEKEGWYLPQIRPKAGGQVYIPGGAGAPVELSVVVTEGGRDFERNLILARGLSVQGHVLDAAGKGVGQAEIHARGFGLQQQAWQWGIQPRSQDPLATSSSDGAFKAKGLPPSEAWVLFARKQGLAGAYGDPFALSRDGATPDIELKLLPGATVRGRVTGLDGPQLGQAQIGFWGQTSELAEQRGFQKLNADGSFELNGLPAGDWTLNVWMNGRAGAQKQVRALQAGEVREGITIELRTGVEVSGVIVGKDGKPAARLSVGLRSFANMGGWVNGQTDGEGRFVFQGVAKGRVQLMTFSGGVQKAIGQPFEAPQSDVRVVYEPDPVVSFKGRVLDPAGQPIPFARIQIRGATDPGGTQMPVQLGGGGSDVLNGVFEVTVTGKLPYTATIDNARDAEGKPLNLVTSKTVIQQVGAEVVITLEAGKEIRGRVVDTEGQPIVGAPVRAGQRQVVRTDKAGNFILTGLGPDKRTLQIGPVPGYASPPMQVVEAGAEPLLITLEKGFQIKGRAEGPDGEPLASGWVTANWKVAGAKQQGHTNGQIQPGGTFTLDGIPAGVSVTVRVQVWNQGGGTAYAPTQVDGVEPGTDDLVVRMGSGLAIEGTVLGPDGEPAQGVFVGATTVEAPHQQSGWIQTDEEGHWKLAGLKAVAYNVRVMQQGGGVNLEPTRVDAPASGVRITLPRTVTMSGRLEGVSNEEAPNWRIRIFDEKGQTRATARVLSDGSWSSGPMADEGKVHVGASRSDHDSYARSGLVAAGTKGVVLRLQTGQSISGTLENVGATAGKASVRAAGGGWHARGRAEDNGRYTIRGLPPGTYVVSASSGSRRVSKADVPAGASGVALHLREPE